MMKGDIPLKYNIVIPSVKSRDKIEINALSVSPVFMETVTNRSKTVEEVKDLIRKRVGVWKIFD